MIYLNKSFDFSRKVKDMALEERPREKMLLHGVKYLSNAELLARSEERRVGKECTG